MTTLEIDPDTKKRSTRTWRLAAAAVVILVAGLVAVRAGNNDSSPEPGVAASGSAVSFETVWPPFGDSQSRRCIDSSVNYLWADLGRCVRSFEGEATFSGDVAGTALWVMLANQGTAVDPNDDKADITAAFNGTYLVKADVAGCGSGEFMIVEQLLFLGWESGQFAGTWQIVPGSGRDELSSITGSGTMPAADTDTTRAHTGTISCG